MCVFTLSPCRLVPLSGQGRGGAEEDGEEQDDAEYDPREASQGEVAIEPGLLLGRPFARDGREDALVDVLLQVDGFAFVAAGQDALAGVGLLVLGGIAFVVVAAVDR